MKKCNACGTQVDEQARFCPSCGSAELVETMSAAQQAQQLDQGQTYPPIFAPTYQVQNVVGVLTSEPYLDNGYAIKICMFNQLNFLRFFVSGHTSEHQIDYYVNTIVKEAMDALSGANK